MNSGLSAYRQIGAVAGVQDADPHRLIQMLMQALVDSLHRAAGQIRNDDMTGKLANINRAMDIVEALRGSLNFDGGELAQNLDALYEYMAVRLTEANATNDVSLLKEVADLISPIKSAWDEIRPQVKASGQPAAPGAPRPGVHV